MFDCFSRYFVLVFDNYQQVADDSELHTEVVTGLEQLPEYGRVFIISCTEPNLLSNSYTPGPRVGWQDLHYCLNKETSAIR